MKRSTDRILTTHTGSLPRPQALVDLLKAKLDRQPVDPAQFEDVAAAATREIVAKQIETGIDVVGDGEMAKISYATYVTDRLSGFDGQGTIPPMADLAEFPDYTRRSMLVEGLGTLKVPACSGPLAWKDRSAVEGDIARFRKALEGRHPQDSFMTAASPGVVAAFLQNQYYPTYERYIETLAETLKEEYEAIHKAGFILQLDCPDLGAGRHAQFATRSTAEFIKRVELHIAAINHAVANIPADRVRLHLCWGNYEGPHHHDIPLRDIIEPVLKARAGALSFEGANPRHGHEWAIFEEVELPEGKIIIPGVIDSSTHYIEHPELVAQRLIRYANLVGRENVIAGTDCGFATFATHVRIDPAIAWAKLKTLSEGAAIASGRLWKA